MVVRPVHGHHAAKIDSLETGGYRGVCRARADRVAQQHNAQTVIITAASRQPKRIIGYSWLSLSAGATGTGTVQQSLFI